MKYKKKPVIIEAIQWNGSNLEDIQKFVGKPLNWFINDTAWQFGMGIPVVEMSIETLEGEMIVSQNDFVIKGVNGEFYPCKPDIFDKTYELVEESEVK